MRLPLLGLLSSCAPEPSTSAIDLPGESGPSVSDFDGWHGSCVSLEASDGSYLEATDGGYAFKKGGPAVFTMQASDLGTYLLYDAEGSYLASEDGPLLREAHLQSDILRMEDGYISGGEWILEASIRDPSRYQLRNRRNDQLLGPDGLVLSGVEASALALVPAEGCAEHPELSLDATGTVTKTTWDDGDLFGIVDTHSHIMSNFGFGGGVYHGGAYHRLGVEHALGDCDIVHGEMGKKDFFGYAYDASGNNTADLTSMVGDLLAGELSEDNHATDGWPTFSEWPDARKRSTHQTQYYRWLERAWLGGLRLVVQHATTNSVICSFAVGEGLQPNLFDCEDMTAVDRILDETWQMQDYIDAQWGGQGQGFFRIVTTPQEAREVIEDGRLAVILGIETSDLFRCNLTPRPDGPVCDEDWIESQLDAYHDRGVRVIFPVHKYDNKFSPGDGSGDFIELGNFLNSGHWTNKTDDCPGGDLPSGFDGGSITFGGLNSPREVYDSEPPNDLSGFPEAPLDTAMTFLPEILEGSVDGHWCQNATITPLGEALVAGMMERGMIIELDHFPEWSYQRAFEILEQAGYPGAAGTHGRNWNGRIYALGGISMYGLGRCQDADNPGSTLQGFANEIALIEAMGGYPAEGFGFDLNGFAGAPRPRFGDDGCGDDQPNPMSYPFPSYAGDVQFTEPYLGERAVDFDTEGMIHIGLLPELIADARADAVSDDDLEPLFRSAEGYVRMWEAAEAWAAAR